MQQSVIERAMRVFVVGAAASAIFACAQHVPRGQIHDIEFAKNDKHIGGILLFQPIKRPPPVRLTFLERKPIERGADYEGISCLADLNPVDDSYSCFIAKKKPEGSTPTKAKAGNAPPGDTIDPTRIVEKITAGRLDSRYCLTLRTQNKQKPDDDVPVMRKEVCRAQFGELTNCVCYEIQHYECKVDKDNECQIGPELLITIKSPPDPGAGSGGHGGTGT